MATKKISELTEVTSPIATDVFPIVNDGETKKVQLTNVKTVLGIDGLDTRLTTVENGWVSANETWTYVSVDDPTGVIKINSDVTTKYSLGMRIKFTNGGNVIYGIITAISYSSPNTILTFLHEIDPTDSLALHLMANSAITNNYYSSMKVPYGFNIDENKWSINFSDATDIVQNTPTTGTWYNIGGLNASIPIGKWKLGYECFMDCYVNTPVTILSLYSTLSTANNSQSDASFTFPALNTVGQNYRIATNSRKDKFVSLVSKTNYYLNFRSTVAVDALELYGSYVTTTIKAICAYL